jgi:DNA-binding helix-hairpin-helix protein with protein kinase domain
VTLASNNIASNNSVNHVMPVESPPTAPAPAPPPLTPTPVTVPTRRPIFDDDLDIPDFLK